MSKARELSVVPQQSLGMKNRIINGAMQIDQRNNGASVTLTAAIQEQQAIINELKSRIEVLENK